MDERIQVFFGLIGGLALFLYGMNSMSDALQKAAGERMKQILHFLTKNPVMGALAGALVTAVLQSSSATTVMVIGFVSAGLMSLPQAISVIFGANIGTTMTAQLMAFKISNYIYPIIFIGFIMNFVSKNEKIRNIGMVIFSFGLLFEGIEIMGSVMKPLADSAFFLDLMGKVKDIPILGVFLGAGMTLVVQSSSATIAVLQNFASQAAPDGVHSVMGLSGAIPILFGDNIGTTITALIASIGQSKNAKRTAVAHSVFNISGTIVFMFFIPVLVKFVTWISPTGNEVDIISRQIANAHTTFNIVCTLVWLPLIPIMVKIVSFIIPGKDKVDEMAPAYLDEHIINQPAAAMVLVSKEMIRLTDSMKGLLSNLKMVITSKNREGIARLYTSDYENVKREQEQITAYITKMLASGTLTEQQSQQSAGFLFLTNTMDRISDRSNDIKNELVSVSERNIELSSESIIELSRTVEGIEDLFTRAMEAVESGNKEDALNIVQKEKNAIRKRVKKFSKNHLARVKNHACDASLTKTYTDILYNLDRMGDGCVAIAEEVMDEVTFEQLKLDELDEAVSYQEVAHALS